MAAVSHLLISKLGQLKSAATLRFWSNRILFQPQPSGKFNNSKSETIKKFTRLQNALRKGIFTRGLLACSPYNKRFQEVSFLPFKHLTLKLIPNTRQYQIN